MTSLLVFFMIALPVLPFYISKGFAGLLALPQKILIIEVAQTLIWGYLMIEVFKRSRIWYVSKNGKLEEIHCADAPLEGILTEFFGKKTFKIEEYLNSAYDIRFGRGYLKPTVLGFIVDCMKQKVVLWNSYKLDLWENIDLYCKIVEMDKHDKATKMVLSVHPM